MNDPRGATDSALDASGTSDARTRNSMAEALQKALRSFGGQDTLAGETLTPEVLTQIAHRAGITSSAQISELARMMGMSVGSGDSGSMSVPQHIIFALNDSECTFPSGSVQAIERVGDVSTVPNTVSWVLGIIHLHGSILNLERDDKERTSRPQVADLFGSLQMLNGILKVIVMDVLAKANHLFI